MAPGKTRINIMLDNDLLDHYREVASQVNKGYQTVINDTLRVTAGLPTAIGGAAFVPTLSASDKQMLEAAANFGAPTGTISAAIAAQNEAMSTARDLIKGQNSAFIAEARKALSAAQTAYDEIREAQRKSLADIQSAASAMGLTNTVSELQKTLEVEREAMLNATAAYRAADLGPFDDLIKQQKEIRDMLKSPFDF